MTERFTVPCNGCAACCRRERIILRAEDDKELYVVIPTRKGNDGPIEFVLPHKPNGDCYYPAYGGDGRSECSIWDHAPTACREFDCRKWWASFDPTQQEALLLDYLDSDVALAAMARSGVPRNIIDQP